MSCLMNSFKFFFFSLTVFISTRLKSVPNPFIVTCWCTGCCAEVLRSDAAMSLLSLCAPLFTSICSEIGNWNPVTVYLASHLS